MNFLILYKKFILESDFELLKKINRIVYDILPVEIKERIVRETIEPYNNLENKYQIIFIHIPKTAGKAVYYSLFNQDMHPHQTIENYYKYDKNKFREYKKIAFVRNPWDRFLSAYKYLITKDNNLTKSKRDNMFYEKYLSEFSNFDEFILNIKKDPKFRSKILNWTHFRPQYDFVTVNDEIVLDHLFKFENLNFGFNKIKNDLSLKKDLKLLERNVNKKKSNNYWEYYTVETAKLIENLYEKDIKSFNYNFPYEKLQ